MKGHAYYQDQVAVYDGLSIRERSEVDAHIAGCRECAADLASHRQMDRRLRSVREPLLDERQRARLAQAAIGKRPQHSASRQKTGSRPGILRPLGALAPVAAVLVLLVAALLAVKALPSQSQQESAAPAPQAAIVRISFDCPGMVEMSSIARTIYAFEQENPDIDVEIKRVGARAALAGTPAIDAAGLQAATADVMCGMPLAEDVASGRVRDLAPFIAADPTFQPDDFYPGFLQGWGERTVASIPTYFGIDMIGYDPAAFDEAGIPYPQPGWTWDDFLRIAVQLTQRDDEVTRYGYADPRGFPPRLAAEFARAPGVPLTYTTMWEVLSWHEALYVKTQAAPVLWLPGDSLEQSYEEAARKFDALRKANKIAMWPVDGLASRGRTNVAPLPATRSGAVQVAGARTPGLVMSGRTQHPDASWRLISYLSQHTPDHYYVIPARRSAAEKGAFWKNLDARTTATYRYALDHLVPWPNEYDPNWVQYGEAVNAVVRREKTAQQALAELAAKGLLRVTPSTPGLRVIATATPAAAR